MRTKKFHSLKIVKIRQTWSKYNLYNLYRLRTPNLLFPTHFQQKWKAKGVTRGYHGENIREKQWQLLFSPRLRSVVSMDHRYLALHDGSEQAEGRGSGKDLNPATPKKELPKPMPEVPYMQMTYAPLERRLDTAIFRALFAASTRQARQFVVHGAVKVNGKKMVYPGYMLNPGDMFSVDPERVMFATGAPKSTAERLSSRRNKAKSKIIEEPSEEEVTESTEGEVVDDAAASTQSSAEPESAEAVEKELRRSHKMDLTKILEAARIILNDKKKEPRAKQKQALREMSRSVRKAMSNINKTSVDSLDEELSILLSQLKVVQAPPPSKAQGPGTVTKAQVKKNKGMITHQHGVRLREALKSMRENPIDSAKPYATPWQPRPYMSAFAFIPRYLEVNQNICSAVYLRHPVARPGSAEVPTPFDPSLSQMAFTWYLRRR